MNSKLASLKKRWQLVLISLLNLPIFIYLIFVLYISCIGVYNPESSFIFTTAELILYALLFTAYMPYILALSIISIPFLFWYLWKIGGVIPPSGEIRPMSETFKEHLGSYDEILVVLEKKKREYEQELGEVEYNKLMLDNINLQIKALEKAREDGETHMKQLKALEEEQGRVGL